MKNAVLHRRDLPHLDVPGATYFVTTCLHGSIPANGWLDLTRLKNDLDRRVRPKEMSPADWDNYLWKLKFARADHWLDTNPTSRCLQDPNLANIVVNAIQHFKNVRYRLFAFVVMPSHCHWAFQPLTEWFDRRPISNLPPRSQIVHSINRFTAERCNRLLGKTGPFWQSESYDHVVRGGGELDRIIAYIEGNPVKAGLVERAEDWRFSSAFHSSNRES